MILLIVFCLFFFRNANSLDVTAAFNMIKSALDYYNSHSVLLIFNESHSSSDLFQLLTLQKRLSSRSNFFFTSITTPSALPKDFEVYRVSLRETVFIWNPNDNFNHIWEKFSNEIDITLRKWFLATSNLTSEAFNNITIPLNSEFTIAIGYPQSGYSLEEIYDVTPGLRLSNPLGQWLVNSQEFQLQASKDMFTRRRDFNGATIKVAAPYSDTCDLFALLLKTTAIAVCTNHMMWKLMAEILNATTEFTVVPELSEDTIRDGYFDLTFRSAHTTVDLLKTRDYVWPTFFVHVLVTTSYTTQRVKWDTYILPFRSEMWTVILIWIILWDLILASVQFIYRVKRKNKNSFFRFLRVFCPSKAFSTRIILLMMFIAPAVLFRGYSAVLISFLTVQLDKEPFRNIEELSLDKDYKLGWQNDFKLEDYWNLNSTNPLSEALMKNNIVPADELPASDAQGLERMCDEKFSYLTITEVLMANNPGCKFYTFEQRFLIFFISMEMKKGSWYKFYLDRCQRVFEYTGVRKEMSRHIVREFVKFDALEIEDNTKVPSIKMENIILPFVVLLLGMIASLFLLLLEIIFFKLKSKRVRSLAVFIPLKRIERRTGHFEFVM